MLFKIPALKIYAHYKETKSSCHGKPGESTLAKAVCIIKAGAS